MKILGIDPALNHLGWAIVAERKSEKEVSWITGRIESDGKVGLARLAHLRDELELLIDVQKPDRIVLEGYAFGAKFHAADMGEVGGIVKLMAHDHKIELYVVPPASLKKWVTGSGKADKVVVRAKLLKKYGAEFDTQDEAEAFGCAVWGLEAK